VNEQNQKVIVVHRIRRPSHCLGREQVGNRSVLLFARRGSLRNLNR
jgi:hypothetical protein